jgi:hypothetical protein
VDELDLVFHMKEVAACWSALAFELKLAAESDHPRFESVARQIEQVRQREQRWHELALQIPLPND